MITDFKSASRNTEAIDIRVRLHLGHPVYVLYLMRLPVNLSFNIKLKFVDIEHRYGN